MTRLRNIRRIKWRGEGAPSCIENNAAAADGNRSAARKEASYLRVCRDRRKKSSPLLQLAMHLHISSIMSNRRGGRMMSFCDSGAENLQHVIEGVVGAHQRVYACDKTVGAEYRAGASAAVLGKLEKSVKC